jgi:uncharacterized damage-inducible protein DinB
MMRDQLVRFLRYNAWANQRLIAMMEQLTPTEQMSGSLSYGSAFHTLRHMLDAEVVWRHTILADNPAPDMMHVQTLDTLSEVKVFWQEERRRMFELLDLLPDEQLNEARLAPWRDKQYAIRDIFLHVVNHASNHRSEIGWYLTACGHSPGDLEFVDYLDSVKS